MNGNNKTPSNTQESNAQITEDKRVTSKGGLRKEIIGGCIGTLVGLISGIYFLSVAHLWVRYQFTFLTLIAGSISIAIAGAIGTTRNGIVQILGAAIGTVITTFIYFAFWINNSNPSTGLFMSIVISLFVAIPNSLSGAILGLLLGRIGNLITGKEDYGLLVSAFCVSIAPAFASFGVLYSLMNWN